MRGLALALLVSVLAIPGVDASALALLQSTSGACIGPSTCDFSAAETGPGAATSLQRAYTSTTGPNTYDFHASGAMTIGDYDRFAASATASGQANLDFTIPGGAGPSTRGFGRADLFDALLVPGAGFGTLRMVWRVTGSLDVGWATSDALNTDPLSAVQLVFSCAAQVRGSAIPLGCPDPSFLWRTSGPVDEVVLIDIPLVFGSLIDYALTITLLASTGVGTTWSDSIAFNGNAVGDFASTGVLEDVLLLDAAGGLLDASLIQAESLFRYDLVGQTAPEPAAGLLAGGGLLVLGLARRARRRTPGPAGGPDGQPVRPGV